MYSSGLGAVLIGEHRAVFETVNLGVKIVLAVQLFSFGHTAVSLQNTCSALQKI